MLGFGVKFFCCCQITIGYVNYTNSLDVQRIHNCDKFISNKLVMLYFHQRRYICRFKEDHNILSEVHKNPNIFLETPMLSVGLKYFHPRPKYFHS